MSLMERIREVINCECAERNSNTPDYILAEYLLDCLAAFDKATMARDNWYSADRVNTINYPVKTDVLDNGLNTGSI